MVAVFVLTASVAAAQAPTITTAPVAVPSEIAAPIAALLAPQVTTVTTSTTKVEMWWVTSLPLRDGAWLGETTGRATGGAA